MKSTTLPAIIFAAVPFVALMFIGDAMNDANTANGNTLVEDPTSSPESDVAPSGGEGTVSPFSEPSSPALSPPAPAPRPQYSSTQLAMLATNNRYRASAGLRPHVMNLALNRAAQKQAEYLARHNTLSHYVNGTPAGRAAAEGYRRYAGENIAFNHQGTVSRAFQQWRNSSGHWRNLTGNHREAGFGAARSRRGVVYFVTMYGARTSGGARRTTTYSTAGHRRRGLLQTLWRRRR